MPASGSHTEVQAGASVVWEPKHLAEHVALLSGNFCPLCDKCYDDDDYESKMMQCGKCDRWVHSKCENLSGTEGWNLFITVSFSDSYPDSPLSPPNVKTVAVLREFFIINFLSLESTT